MKIRDEAINDRDKIRACVTLAFAEVLHSQQTENAIIDGLRDANALTLALVAEKDDAIVGYIAFSKVLIAGKDLNWHGLGPVAVEPKHQRMGIGQQLIRAGLTRLREMNAAGCVLLGEPEYYARFGFRNYPHLSLDGVPQQYFQAVSFIGLSIPSGEVTYHDAFNARPETE